MEYCSLMPYTYKPRVRAGYLSHPIFCGKSLRQLERDTKENRVQLARYLKTKRGPVRLRNTLASVLGTTVAKLEEAIVP